MTQMAFIVNSDQKQILEGIFHNASNLQERLSLYFQPKVNLKTGEVIGYEALMRCLGGDLGYTTPERILEMAAFYGLTDDLNRWVVTQTCQALKEIPSIHVAMNICPQSLTKEFALFTLETLLKEGISPSRLQMEITEQNKASDLKTLAHTISWLRRQGITIALDDFGTGHATMEYLINLDLDLVKIDRSYVQGIENDKGKRTTLKAMINLIQTCDVPILCEGIENKEQQKVLKSLGIEWGQGYYLGMPTSLDELKETILAPTKTAKVITMRG